MWRIALDHNDSDSFWRMLSDDERARASRFHREVDRRHFVVAHGMLRRILGDYVGVAASELAFSAGEHGKPLFAERSAIGQVEFNLAHSGEVALLAVARGRAVGVDVERWNAAVEHLALAEYCFSPPERETLRHLADAKELVVAAFFAAWSRKEAYIKATGHGITRGLDHFEVSLMPGEPARLVADQNDATAAERWFMRDLVVGAEYSAALVVAAPVDDVLLFDAV